MATTGSSRLRTAIVCTALAAFIASCGQAAVKVQAGGATHDTDDSGTVHSRTLQQADSGAGAVEVCPSSDISVPTTASPPPAPQSDQPPATIDAETLRASEADLAKVSALGLARVALCDGAVGYVEFQTNSEGCFTVFADLERSRILGQQRTVGSLQVLHPLEAGC